MARHTLENQSSASIPTPGTGNTTVFVDTADKHLKIKNDAGLVTDISTAGSGITALTGDVTATGPGSAAASISDPTVTGKLLTGYVASSGVVAATDTILQAFNKLGSIREREWFGTAQDGDVTITVNTTLVRDMYYNNLTINSGATLNPNGFRIFCANTLTVNAGGFISRDGNPGLLSVGGVALPAGTLLGASAGGAGGGAAGGTASAALSTAIGSAGGNGGAGAAGAGGGGSTATIPAVTLGGIEGVSHVRQAVVGRDISNVQFNGGTGGGGGGGGGAANSGGGAGSGGAIVLLSATTITGSGTISAMGASGASAPGANGGGGGGGGGGALILISSNDTTLTSLTLSVAGGTSGGGNGTGVAGLAGSTGRIFRVMV